MKDNIYGLLVHGYGQLAHCSWQQATKQLVLKLLCAYGASLRWMKDLALVAVERAHQAGHASSL